MKLLRPAIGLTLFFLALCLVFPAIIYGISQVAFPLQANGSLLKDRNGKLIGSALIAQGFAKPEYFHPRPSAAGNGYDAVNSGGTNLGPTSDKLVNGVHKKLPDGKDDPGNFDGLNDLAKAYRTENNLAPDAVIPADAVTRSASGLDPDISLENAQLQTTRVAKARNLPTDTVAQQVQASIEQPFLGIFGEPKVNVLRLNRALDEHPNTLTP